MKKRVPQKQKQKQKQKQSVNIKNIITIGKSKRAAKPKKAAAAPARQAPPTIMTTQVYHQYFSPPERNPMRSVEAQVINPIADNVLKPVAAAERIIEGKVKDDIFREKDDEKEQMRFFYGAAKENVLKDVKRKIEVERNRPPPPFDSPPSPPFRTPIFHFD